MISPRAAEIWTRMHQSLRHVPFWLAAGLDEPLFNPIRVNLRPRFAASPSTQSREMLEERVMSALHLLPRNRLCR